MSTTTPTMTTTTITRDRGDRYGPWNGPNKATECDYLHSNENDELSQSTTLEVARHCCRTSAQLNCSVAASFLYVLILLHQPSLVTEIIRSHLIWCVTAELYATNFHFHFQPSKNSITPVRCVALPCADAPHGTAWHRTARRRAASHGTASGVNEPKMDQYYDECNCVHIPVILYARRT